MKIRQSRGCLAGGENQSLLLCGRMVCAPSKCWRCGLVFRKLPCLGSVLSFLLVVGCGHGHSILPGISKLTSAMKIAPASDARSTGRRTVFDLDTAGRSPDGAYQIHSLHATGIRVHSALSYVTPNGSFTQVEYLTPYGVLTLVQSPLRPLPSAPPVTSSSSSSAGAVVDVIGSGTTGRGFSWVVYEDPSGHAHDVHVTFGDSVVDGSVPPSVPLSVIQSVVEGMY
jgi:hypothetical protein